MLESIEKLNKEIEILKQNNIDTDELVKISKDIEQEIDTQFVKLPVDCDGVPINLDNELIVDGYPGTSKVCYMRYLHDGWVIETNKVDTIYHSDRCTRHYYEPTVKSTLNDLIHKAWSVYANGWTIEDMCDKEMIGEIQELVNTYSDKLQIKE